MNVQPPGNDSLIERHQFYATSATLINESARDINGIGHKISNLSTDHDDVKEMVKSAKTTIHVVTGIAVFVSTIIIGIAGWYIQRTVDSYDKYIQRIDTLEKSELKTQSAMETYKDVINGLEKYRVESNSTIEKLRKTANSNDEFLEKYKIAIEGIEMNQKGNKK
jgi:prefoldin subunit 5